MNKRTNVYVIAGLLSLLSVLPTSASASTDAYHLVQKYARQFNIPTEFALDVARVETNVKCGRVGQAGERGPLQILPSTARSLGYRNIAKASCSTQTEAGMKHLAMCFNGAKGNTRLAAMCHNQGISVLYGKQPSKKAKRYASMVLR